MSANSTSTSATPLYSIYPSGTTGTGHKTTSLYLFTFLITIIVLGLVCSGLLLRGYYVRRQFRIRVEQALASGRPLPLDAAKYLGLDSGRGGRGGKKVVEIGPMPCLWEAEMWRDENIDRASKGWESLTPLSMLRFPPKSKTPPPSAPLQTHEPRRRSYLRRAFFLPESPNPRPASEMNPPTRPPAQRLVTGASLKQEGPVFKVPKQGEECVVGVLIALPVETRKGEQEREAMEEEDVGVPEICLGVMSCHVGRDDREDK